MQRAKKTTAARALGPAFISPYLAARQVRASRARRKLFQRFDCGAADKPRRKASAAPRTFKGRPIKPASVCAASRRPTRAGAYYWPRRRGTRNRYTGCATARVSLSWARADSDLRGAEWGDAGPDLRPETVHIPRGFGHCFWFGARASGRSPPWREFYFRDLREVTGIFWSCWGGWGWAFVKLQWLLVLVGFDVEVAMRVW